jgi:hypothetical protein
MKHEFISAEELGFMVLVPKHMRRPSPLQEMHVLVDVAVLVLTGFLFDVSLDGSSHLFSPRRNTLCSETSTPETPFFATRVCLTSAIPVTAPFVPSYKKIESQQLCSGIY